MSIVPSLDRQNVALAWAPADASATIAEPALTVREVALGDIGAAEWDAAMAQVGGSMRSAFGHLRALSFKQPWRRPLIFAVILPGTPKPIGYFTIRFRRDVREFYDGILLDPGHAERWPAAMTAALTACGPGTYRYGWNWSLEASREDDLRALPGVAVETTINAVVQGIDFARWPTWDLYRAKISQNTKRNVKKFTARFADAPVVRRSRLASILDIFTLVKIRGEMYARKGMAFNALGAIVGHLANLVLCPAQGVIASVRGRDQVAATMRLVENRDVTYYLEGSAKADEDGAASYLGLSVLKRAYQAFPKGKFLMGFYIAGDELAEGLIRSRNALRVSDWPNSIVTFAWHPQASTVVATLLG